MDFVGLVGKTLNLSVQHCFRPFLELKRFVSGSQETHQTSAQAPLPMTLTKGMLSTLGHGGWVTIPLGVEVPRDIMGRYIYIPGTLNNQFFMDVW